MWIVLACLTLVLVLSATAEPAPRTTMLHQRGWKFTRKDVSGAEVSGFDDSSWDTVTVPHTWNAHDGESGQPYYRGPAWYRVRLDLSPEQATQSLFLRFGAASLVADVYVNGQSVGRHEGGFSAFCFEITSFVQPGLNVLAVRVDNTLIPNIAPLSGDFTIFGGLYRDVQLLTLAPLSISPLDDASSGVYLTPIAVTHQSATIEVTTKLRNGAAEPARAMVRCTILDAEGTPVASASTDSTVAARGTTDAVVTIMLDKPHLWGGVREPYLYSARIEVLSEGRVVDALEQPLGLRYFHVDPEQGLILNGRPYDVHGVNFHQGRQGQGWVETPAQQEQNIALMREMGCTAVRMAHYQHPEHEHTLCDQAGLVTWAELALVNKMTDSPAFFANARQQLRELIKQNYNHPSVLFWSLYNEPWINKDHDAHAWRLVDELHALAKELDPARLTTGASVTGPEPHLAWAADLAAFNRYWGWYECSPGEWPVRLDGLLQAAGGRSFGIGEYGAGAAVTQHEVPPSHPEAPSQWHPEEWQAHVHETVYPVLAERPWVWCKFIWVMFDFAAYGRNEGDRAGWNDKGLVTGDHQTRKDAFFYYKAQWSIEPFVHITSQRYNPRPPGPAPIKIYSNLDAVELIVNGRSLGLQRSGTGVFIWENVPFNAGTMEVEAMGASKDAAAREVCTWTVTASAE